MSEVLVQEEMPEAPVPGDTSETLIPEEVPGEFLPGRMSCFLSHDRITKRHRRFFCVNAELVTELSGLVFLCAKPQGGKQM